MLVLAVDTATPAVTAGLVHLSPAADADTRPAVATLAARVKVDARAHAEVLTPQILECLTEAGVSRGELDAVVVGIGPGPFTGLRVGMATAAAFGDALGLPVYGVCSLDAIAADAASEQRDPGELLVVTDARRREVYWAKYLNGARVAGPEVNAPVDVPVGDAAAIAGSAAHVDYYDLPVLPNETPSPAGLVAVAAPALLAGIVPEALVPLYLRRPDAVENSFRTLDRTGA
ncbi:tRNA (adenosine(37)-N6)-threonylcarbamoyltransferase complex dimerization subunit type 1 TsaB [Nocardia mangyaensis]|uniref:tRNA (Adenosine(37)-N6)-threonylcarbamoyltransferase complex dimerization subunit type 1 TsaB n=1 Tax=Nocardia mangyaensis TaxID=2213200 RepID=A0A1J0VMU3_9NOCA|nr:tRNA (adenosine(37)-N6)-threonylcarbamoyltransferase complex dimerization subunit type 1 TsaB [Nocardia mangyaensis]APE33325.1 tRNA (adenosine(37)-N6)-threonylcarbamoyltransferase complex dimerization subunit type 1 TsaB [Nocardia mangyaensis]